MPPLPPYAPPIFKLPNELLLAIFRAAIFDDGKFDTQIKLAFTCKRLLVVSAMMPLYIPSAAGHRKWRSGSLWPFCDNPFEVQSLVQQVYPSGKFFSSDAPCCGCLRYRPTDKAYWEEKRTQIFRSCKPRVLEYRTRLYDYLVENWCNMKQPLTENRAWIVECHLCIGNGSMVRPCPECVFKLRVRLWHRDPDCPSLTWLADPDHYAIWYNVPRDWSPEKTVVKHKLRAPPPIPAKKLSEDEKFRQQLSSYKKIYGDEWYKTAGNDKLEIFQQIRFDT
ncbi:hypothetical protein F5Y14DRAFT_460587 [Nemania sp. NC0429]|nr:hypothetical protein F5Y14DRAFT_460587 [Nemania sp. NC0429]